MVKVFIKTYGCSINQSDSEVMAGLLKLEKFEMVNDSDIADVVIVNTCTVKTPTEKKILKYVGELKEKGIPVIVAGCMPQTLPERFEGCCLIGPSHINHIVEIVEEAINDNPISMLVPEENERLNIPKIRKNNAIEILPISRGCLGNCSYCLVKKARGDLISYEKEAIVRQARKAITDGVRELWLTAQDTGCYNWYLKEKRLPNLVERILRIPGLFYVRLGMMNPNHAIELVDDLIKLFSSNKLFKFIHLPIQSGNNDVLKAMNRKYTVEQYEDIVSKLKEAIPDITIATDIICGFPGETKEQFNDTVELVNRTKPDVVNISRYWDRPKTKSFEMDNKVHERDTKERSRKLSEVFRWVSFDRNKKWKNWKGEILIDGHGSNKTSVGRNYAYKQVVVNGVYPLGSIIEVEIESIDVFHLKGKEVMHSTKIVKIR